MSHNNVTFLQFLYVTLQNYHFVDNMPKLLIFLYKGFFIKESTSFLRNKNLVTPQIEILSNMNTFTKIRK